MRARGAKATDIVILVVAADDGVMPQTLEALSHARAAQVPIIVALNKIDKPESRPQQVMTQLSDKGLIPEKWGGDTLYALISAKQKKGIEEILDHILLQAEVLDLKADPQKPAMGTVIEARLDRGRGSVATLLVKEGTLNVGDPIVVGQFGGKVRAMIDENGKIIATWYKISPQTTVSEALKGAGEIRGKRKTMQIKANGIQMNYELSGKKGAPVVVLSHSLCCNLFMWNPQMDVLNPHFQVLRYDIRGRVAAHSVESGANCSCHHCQ
jgi:translation initiation factor IF-2